MQTKRNAVNSKEQKTMKKSKIDCITISNIDKLTRYIQVKSLQKYSHIHTYKFDQVFYCVQRMKKNSHLKYDMHGTLQPCESSDWQRLINNCFIYSLCCTEYCKFHLRTVLTLNCQFDTFSSDDMPSVISWQHGQSIKNYWSILSESLCERYDYTRIAQILNVYGKVDCLPNRLSILIHYVRVHFIYILVCACERDFWTNTTLHDLSFSFICFFSRSIFCLLYLFGFRCFFSLFSSSHFIIRLWANFLCIHLCLSLCCIHHQPSCIASTSFLSRRLFFCWTFFLVQWAEKIIKSGKISEFHKKEGHIQHNKKRSRRKRTNFFRSMANKKREK